MIATNVSTVNNCTKASNQTEKMEYVNRIKLIMEFSRCNQVVQIIRFVPKNARINIKIPKAYLFARDFIDE